MKPEALKVFIHEFRVKLPMGVDTPGNGNRIPETMRRYQLRGTPSLLLIDRKGRLLAHQMGQEGDLVLGAASRLVIDEPA